MALTSCEIYLDLKWHEKCIIVVIDVDDHGAEFSITNAKLYVPVVTSSIRDNTKLLEQLKSGFRRTIK